MPWQPLRSWQRNSIGRLLVTVALDPPNVSNDVGERRSLTELTERLVQYTTELRLPVTWGVQDPVHARATRSIVKWSTTREVAHEVAVLADADWITPLVGRQRLANELARRVLHARTKGLATTTLLKRDTDFGDLLDLLVKHGITATAEIGTRSKKLPRTSAVRCLHYGVWELPCSGKLPEKFKWFTRDRLLGRIRRAADEASLFHLFVDAPAVSARGRVCEMELARSLARIAELRARGILQVETLSTTASRLSDVPAAIPQQSILRIAA